MARPSKLLAALMLASCAFSQHANAKEQAQVAESEAPRELALMGTIPIYWGETAGIDEVLSGAAPSHWARDVLEEDFALAPLDYLSADALSGREYLLMAQPRGLSAEENVALDAWVRQGGKLLLFADPMMTGESRFHIGDRRRPQDVSLLSPILARWGLELRFDPAQTEGPQAVDHFGERLPVNLRGEFAPVGEAQYCAIPGDGLLAHCTIGDGQAMIVADAAMLDIAEPDAGAESALRWLVGHIFPNLRDNAGNTPVHDAVTSEDGGDSAEMRDSSPHAHTELDGTRSQ